MIRLFRNNETNFNHNEWVLNEVIGCKPSEGVNDDYITELEYPLEDSKNISSNLVVGGLVSVPTLDSRPDQLFRIIDKDTSSTTITVQMQAKLLADLKENRVLPMTLTGLTRKQAIQAVLNAALDPHTYSVGNLDTNTNNSVIVNIQEGSVLNALIGAENSVLSEYGGEFIINNNMIDIVDSRGSDNGVVIEYGKNLSSISEKINNVDLATVLIPKSGDYRLPEYYIESPNVGAYEKRYFKDVEMNLNIWDGENEQGEDQITLAEAHNLMRATCNKMFTVDKVDQMTFNYTIDFVELSKTEEYKNYAVLETVHIGDTVTVRHKKLNLDLQGRVNKIVYSVDSEGCTTIDTVEIGFSRKDITDIIKTTVKQIKFAKDEIRLALNNSISGVEYELSLANDKINAVVQKDGTGMGWTLSQVAFIVACLGASGANVQIDQYGLTINNGKLFLKNSSGNIVFQVDLNGICNAIGGFIVKDGSSSCKMNSNGITLTNSNGYTSRLFVKNDATALQILDDLFIGKGIFVTAQSYFHSNVYIDDILEVGSNTNITGSLDVGDDLDIDGYLYGTGGEFLNDLYVDDTVFCETLEVMGGEKNCVQETENYGLRKINAYETAEYFFGDLGSGNIKDGECLITIDPIFQECINTSIEYHVFVQAYDGIITSIKRYPDYFVVYGTDETVFSWELKAKRLGFENVRLTQRTEKYKVDTLILEKDLLINECEDNSNWLLENNITDITDILLVSEYQNVEEILLQEVV